MNDKSIRELELMSSAITGLKNTVLMGGFYTDLKDLYLLLLDKETELDKVIGERLSDMEKELNK